MHGIFLQNTKVNLYTFVVMYDSVVFILLVCDLNIMCIVLYGMVWYGMA